MSPRTAALILNYGRATDGRRFTVSKYRRAKRMRTVVDESRGRRG